MVEGLSVYHILADVSNSVGPGSILTRFWRHREVTLSSIAVRKRGLNVSPSNEDEKRVGALCFWPRTLEIHGQLEIEEE